MAEYRSGHFAEAYDMLIAAANGESNNPHVVGTSPFYRALSLYRQGKENEARRLATEAASKMKPLHKDEKNPLANDASPDDLILWLAYREARSLITFEPAPAATTQTDRNDGATGIHPIGFPRRRFRNPPVGRGDEPKGIEERTGMEGSLSRRSRVS
jgi:hypothetical protein